MEQVAVSEGFTMYVGDVLDCLYAIPDQSVHMCVTSPPYWALRDYGVVGQLGLEETPEEYVENLVEVFREVRRVMRDDATLWLNLGDGYAANRSYQVPDNKHTNVGNRMGATIPIDLKAKDLIGMPWRVAFALQQPYYTGQIAEERNRAWLAALVDGEGCIGIRRQDSHSNGLDEPRCQDSFVPYLVITNSDRELLDRCVELTGYGKVAVKAEPSTDSRGVNQRRTSYGWRLDGNKAVDVIREIYPFLVVKRKQAVIAYSLDVSNKRGKTLRGNKRLPVEEQERRETLKRLVNSANQREQIVDVPGWCEEPPSMFEPGWYLRSDIIWNKMNPMPSSVRDRPTTSHEYIFLLTKKPTYFYDKIAIAEPAAWERWGTQFNPKHEGNGGGAGWIKTLTKRQIMEKIGPRHPRPNGVEVSGGGGNQADGTIPFDGRTRNKRTVWTFPTQSFKGAHYATFPEALAETCIMAGSSALGCCPKCGNPWKRVVERRDTGYDGSAYGERAIDATGGAITGGTKKSTLGSSNGKLTAQEHTVSWEATCECDEVAIPCTILDIFIGSGTTAQVARSLGRKCIGIDLDRRNLDMAIDRYNTPTREEKKSKIKTKARKPQVAQLSLDIE